MIITDHAMFEGHFKAHHVLIDKVYEHWNKMCYRDNDALMLKYREHRIEPNESLPGVRLNAVHFYLIHKPNDIV